MIDINRVLQAAQDQDSSDIHLVCGFPPMIRVHSVKTALEFENNTP